MKKEFENIFIIDSKVLFDSSRIVFNLQKDLFLTYDFALKKHIEDLGGNVDYLDHLVDADTMQANNYLIYNFFKDWHYDKDGNDIFIYKDVPFGFSFRLEFWNDFVTYARLYLSLNYLLSYKFDTLYTLTKDDLVIDILSTLGIEFTKISTTRLSNEENIFYFPISKWLNSKINPKGMDFVKKKIKEFVVYIVSLMLILADKVRLKNYNYSLFIQKYHPTYKIINKLSSNNKVKVVLENFTRNSSLKAKLHERIIPIFPYIKKLYITKAYELLNNFNKSKCQKIILTTGNDISEQMYALIELKLQDRVQEHIKTLDSCINYLEKNKVDLVVLIANMGHITTLFDLVCKHKKIQSFLIINGILAKNYQDEAHYATFINSYSNNIKENYFKDIENVYVLGDPRMDTYSLIEKNQINREIPTITIGGSGFNPTDLNSYVAVEFDFMYDILKAFSVLKEKGEKFKLIIKVRPNGYEEQYQRFVRQYFNDLEIKLTSTTPMIEVLKKTDFYISIYSQTLFEASCLGIPVVYYKKDTEITNKPFDNDSELVTILNTNDMIQAFYDFKVNHQRYELFLNPKVMEQYIGFLDGNNLTRNIDFIYKILEKESLK